MRNCCGSRPRRGCESPGFRATSQAGKTTSLIVAGAADDIIRDTMWARFLSSILLFPLGLTAYPNQPVVAKKVQSSELNPPEEFVGPKDDFVGPLDSGGNAEDGQHRDDGGPGDGSEQENSGDRDWLPVLRPMSLDGQSGGVRTPLNNRLLIRLPGLVERPGSAHHSLEAWLQWRMALARFESARMRIVAPTLRPHAPPHLV